MVVAATKYRNITAEGYFDRDRGTGTPAGKTVCKGFPQSGCFDAYNRITLWVETFATLESLNADGVFLDFLAMGLNSPFGEKPEELLQSGCILKGFGGYDPLYLIVAEG